MSGDREALVFLEAEAKANPEKYSELVTLTQKRLWHQLTTSLQSLDPWFFEAQRLIALHDGCIKHISKHLGSLQYIQFVVAASEQYENETEAIAALEGHLEGVKEDAQAGLVLKMAICVRKLAQGQLEDGKKLIEEGQGLLDGYSGIMTASAQSSFFRSQYEFHKLQHNSVESSKACLLYLSYTPLDTISAEAQQRLAGDLALAILVGDHVYNFGEVLQHPVLQALQGTAQAWLLDMLSACNTGNIAAFDTIFKAQKGAVPELAQNDAFLQQKVRIMTLMEFCFKRGGEQRTASFEEVGQACELGAGSVELLLMRTFSLGVMRGVIDQVAQKVRFTWVQPRVLEPDQIAELNSRLGGWAQAVGETTKYVTNNAPDLIDLGPIAS
jgi:26S proteasome regulatory subunit N9